jgi:dihydrolipoamide dehydrogenase
LSNFNSLMSTHMSRTGILTSAFQEISPSLLASLNQLDSSETSGQVHPNIKEQLSESSQYEADIVIIGSGPAGYVAAIRAAQLGARTVIVEKNTVGGVCLNVGCIPTKVLLACVAVLNNVKNGADFGVKVNSYELDVAAMMERKRRVVKQLVSGVEGLLRKNKVRLIRGHATINDPHTVAIDTAEGKQIVKTRNILIATGSVPATLPIPGLELGENVWTSTEALEFDRPPKSMLIVGAGAIGLEAGYTFARLGTDVLVVELMSQILPAADTETANTLQKALERAGMKFMLDSTVTRAEDTANGKRVFIRRGNNSEESFDCEKVLVAVGRRAVLDGFGLENVGVNTDKRKIIVNEHMQTNVPNIYAAGDCIGEPMLAHVAWTESIVAVEHAMGMDSRMDYKAFPACVYTIPECASVGLTEQQARKRYRDVRIGKYTFSHNGKAMGIGETEGFIKFVIEPRYGEILGVHMVGPHVTDLIAEATLAIRNELTVDEVIATIHPHPTLSEVAQEAAMDTQSRSIHK